MSFIVTAPTPDPSEPDIVSGPFWPDINPGKVREEQRIDNAIHPGRLKAVLIEAIATVNGDLRDWRLIQQEAGHGRLTDIDDEEIDGEKIKVYRYRRAVGCLAKALLLERYRDMDSTAAGDRKANALADPIDDCRRDYLHAVSDIVGRGRCTVELI